MPFGIYVSPDGVARRAKYLYVGDENGVAQEAKSSFIGIFQDAPPQSGQKFFWSGVVPFSTGESFAKKIKWYPLEPRTWAQLDAKHTTWRNWQVATWHDLLYGSMTKEGDVV